MSELQNQLQSNRRLVSVDNYDLSLRELMAMFEDETLRIPPEYQRQFVWDETRQSMLVESLFLGIPIPNIFFATNNDSSWEVVDGVQRICSLLRFVAKEEVLELLKIKNALKIVGLDKLSKLNGCEFKKLDKTIQVSFMTRALRITVLNDKSDIDVRFDLFERLNTGGVALTHQEIRNCIFRGAFNEGIKDLACDDNFKKTVAFKSGDQQNGTREEFILRFFAYYERYTRFDHSVKDFLNDYMRDNSKRVISKKMSTLFIKTFSFLAKELPNGICRGKRKITPVNLFEAISVGTALALSTGGNLKRGVLKRCLEDDALRKYTTGATNSPKVVKNRIEYVKNILL